MNTKPNLKAIIEKNLDKTGHIPSKGQSTLPKEGWLDSYKSGGQPCYNCGGMYKQGGSYNSSWMLTNPKPAPVSFPRMQLAGSVSSQDSLRHQAGKMFNFEETKGSPIGGGLDDWGYHQSQMPWNTTPKNWKKPETPKQAVDLYMQEIATNPILGYFPSAMEKAEAGDFLYNTGRDARVYMLDQYLKSKGEAGLPNRGSYNVDTKTEKWTPELQQSLNEQWNKYSQEINKLPRQSRRELLNNGRGYYYKNTYSADTPGVTYWSRSQEQKPGSVYDNQTGYWYHRGADGSLSPQFDKTWKPRIWESVNTYENGGDISIPDLNADKWLMKYDDGGMSSSADILNNPEVYKTFHKRMANAPEDVKIKAAEQLYRKGVMPSQWVGSAPVSAPIVNTVEELTSPNAYWTSNQDREDYRNKLKDVAKQALSSESDENFLIETPYHKIVEGNNCINGVCGLNRAAGLKYNNPTDNDRYLGNTKFSDAVKQGKEDYYQVSGNFQIGDHIQYLNNKGVPHHSKMIYDITKDKDGNSQYHVIHNSGGKSFVENVYSEKELKNMKSGDRNAMNTSGYSKINIYRPGYTLDKPLLDKERQTKTSPEARKALEDRKAMIDWETSHEPGYNYSIRPESKSYNDQPEGMKKFVEFANDQSKINDLVKKLGVDKATVHDELLNTFGELGEENKWTNPWIGGDISKGISPISIPLESAAEKVGSFFNVGKSKSVGPGQIKMETLDIEEKRAKKANQKSLKELFGIKDMSDLQDFEKVIPLMTALNIRNRNWMENQEENLSAKLMGIPGVSANNIKYGVGRWTPYMYRGTLVDPIAAVRKRAEENANEYRMSAKDREKYIDSYINENLDPNSLKMFSKGSYADRVYNNINENLARTIPYSTYRNDQGEFVYSGQELQPVSVRAVRKKQYGGWLDEYQVGGQDAPLPAIGSKAYYDLQKANQNRTDAIPSRGNQREQAILQNVGQSKLAAQEAARVAANREGLSQYNPKPGDAEHRRIMAQKYAAEHGGYSDEQGNYHQGLLGDAADSRIANRTWENIIEPGINAEMVMSGAGLVGKGLKGIGKYASENIAKSTESGLLSNTYKLNPWAFKANPEAYYRKIGDEGLNDALESGLIRAKQQPKNVSTGEYDMSYFKNYQHKDPYFAKGKPLETYEGKYMAEVEKIPMEERAGYPSTVYVPKDILKTSNPNLKLYEKNWLKGYKEVFKPNITSSIENQKLTFSNPEIVRGPIPNPYVGTTIDVGKAGPNIVGEKIDQSIAPYIGRVEKEYSPAEKVWRSFFKNEPPPYPGSSIDKKKKGGMITDPMGQWAHPGENTRIPSNNITMEGVGYPVLAKASNGQQQMMYPGQNYYFPGASHVDEYPMMESGGWLSKYQEGGTEYKGSSIVDYLATKGYSGKKAFRKDLADKYGVEDYNFSAKKNTELLNKLRENDKLLLENKQSFTPVPIERIEEMNRPVKKVAATPPIENKKTAEPANAEPSKLISPSFAFNSQGLYQPRFNETPNLKSKVNINNVPAGVRPKEQVVEKKEQPKKSVAPTPSMFSSVPQDYKNLANPLPKGTVVRNDSPWYQGAVNTFSNAMNNAFPQGSVILNQTGFTKEGVKNMTKDVIINAVSKLSPEKGRLAENYFKRQDLKNNDELQETKTKLNISNNKSLDIVTGDTIPLLTKNIKDDISNRYIIPGQIDLTNTKWGYRNRGEYKDITTEGGDITLFSNLVPAKEYFKNNPNSKDTDSFIGLSPDGTPLAGNKKDFINSNALISQTFSNKIVDFPRDSNGKLILKPASAKASNRHLAPVTTVLNDDGKTGFGSINFLIPKKNKDTNSFGDITGGRVIFKAPDGKMKLAIGSAENIAQIFDQFKKEGNYPYLTAFTNDNGTYGPGLRTKSGNITGEDLKKYQGANETGSVFMYLKPGDYNRETKTKTKFKDVQMSTPNIRTEKDESFKKGHSLTNEQKAVILHHTGYSDTTGVSKGMSKAMQGVADQFSKPGESSHVVIDFDGTRYNYAKPSQVAFHAGKSLMDGRENVNDFGIGIEFQGDTDKKHLTDKQIDSFVEYISPIIKKNKIPLSSILTHKEIRSNYMKKNPQDKQVLGKPDVNDVDYKRIIDALKKKKIYKEGGDVTGSVNQTNSWLDQYK